MKAAKKDKQGRDLSRSGREPLIAARATGGCTRSGRQAATVLPRSWS